MVRMGMPPDPDDETPMRSHADAEPEPGAAPGPGAESLLAVAIEAAHAAAADLVGRFGQSMTDVRAKSSPTDLVSEADVAAETAIRAVLARRRPDDAILGEEGGATGDGDGDLRWVIDPLDGTTNFLFGVPQWAVSVACEDRDGALVGVVLDPNRSELFAATRGGPPTLGGEPIAASGADDLATALVATGFGYAADMRARQAQVLTRVLPAVRDIRRAGAAALDLAWLACGRYDLYWERGVKPWDIAAGGLIARRAGLETVTLAESDDGPSGIIAGPPRLVAELRALVLGD
jgi:myo-inositol-1(or 4)-monophosphatase